jgi:hypothetical protein
MAASPLRFSACDFWRQDHHHLDRRILGDLGVAIEENTAGTDVPGGAFVSPVILRPNRNGRFQGKTFGSTPFRLQCGTHAYTSLRVLMAKNNNGPTTFALRADGL